jgi:outer membrane biosynthesis protein TonB
MLVVVGCRGAELAAVPTEVAKAAEILVPTATETPLPTATEGPEPSATETAAPTETSSPEPTETPRPTDTPAPTSTPEPTNTKLPTSKPAPPTFTLIPTDPLAPPPPRPPTEAPLTAGNVVIGTILYDGVVASVESDEYVANMNREGSAVDLAGWRLNADDEGRDFWFPSLALQPGQSCRVNSNESHPASCGFK